MAVPFPLSEPVTIGQIAVDREGDLWLRVTIAGIGLPEDALVLDASGAWRVLRMPPVIASTSHAQYVDAISSREAWLGTPAGLFHTTDGGRIWRNITWPRPLQVGGTQTPEATAQRLGR